MVARLSFESPPSWCGRHSCFFAILTFDCQENIEFQNTQQFCSDGRSDVEWLSCQESTKDFFLRSRQRTSSFFLLDTSCNQFPFLGNSSLSVLKQNLISVRFERNVSQARKTILLHQILWFSYTQYIPLLLSIPVLLAFCQLLLVGERNCLFRKGLPVLSLIRFVGQNKK